MGPVSDAADVQPLSPNDRRRAYSALFAGVAVSTTGFLASNTVNGLIAENGLIGPCLVCVMASALSALAMLTAPRRMGIGIHKAADASSRTGPARGQRLDDAHVTLALVSMVSGQFVMVLLMTMTPLHIRHEGHGLGAIGLVISAHTLGMYALSPITGQLVDRFGRVPLRDRCRAVAGAGGAAAAAAARRISAAREMTELLLGV